MQLHEDLAKFISALLQQAVRDWQNTKGKSTQEHSDTARAMLFNDTYKLLIGQCRLSTQELLDIASPTEDMVPISLFRRAIAKPIE